MLQYINIHDPNSPSGQKEPTTLSYEVFGKSLHSAPIVLVNHALTGNSQVSGENGWWKTVIGPGKTMDTEKCTIICFNIPGNGYGSSEINQYFTTKKIAQLFLLGLEKLAIPQLYAIIGGSIGGAIGWEMISQKNNIAQKFIPIASDYKTSDWLHAQCTIQKFLLESPEKPLEKARMHAMLCYRTPESINKRFQNKKNKSTDRRLSEEWLNYHGEKLNDRYQIESYRRMNHLLTTINTDLQNIENTQVEIHLIAIATDLFFPAKEIKETYHQLKKTSKNVHYHEINSDHGHDAFLIEYEQLNHILNPIFHYHEQQFHYHIQEQSAY